jgi:hypothetical protein
MERSLIKSLHCTTVYTESETKREATKLQEFFMLMNLKGRVHGQKPLVRVCYLPGEDVSEELES